jgi:thiamine biosynthesis lipoprotein
VAGAIDLASEARSTPAARPPDYAEHVFGSMGITVRITAHPPTSRPEDRAWRSVIEEAERIFGREDRRFSRFRRDSELSAVNRAAGTWTRVSPEFSEVLSRALRAARSTGGLFDPTVLPALLAAGYDRDFNRVRLDESPAIVAPRACGRWDEIQIDGDRVRLPRGVALDFGGIVKGWTVDRAARAASSLPWAIVEAGGDLRLAGSAPAGGLEVGIEDPENRDHELIRLRLAGGALATSSVLSRTWGPHRHQHIDPRTGLPARTELLQATVWAPTCAEAEVLATWALLSGRGALDHVPGLVVTREGLVLVNLPGEEAAA